MAFELPQLPYAYDALEPHIDARTMEIHHTKHHNAYTTNLNAAITGTELEGKSIEEILANLDLLRKDAAFRWELSQIENNGPDFREKALEELQGTMETGALGAEGGALGGMGGGGGPSLPSPSGGGDASPDLGSPDTNLPAFGPPAPGTTGEDPSGNEAASEQAPEA